MKIFELLQNPIIKTIGVILVIYFALFANKETPQSLGNRLSPENLKKNFSEVSEQSKFIITNVKAANEYSKLKNTAIISTEDIENGPSEIKVACGDEVEISYGIYTKEGKQIIFFEAKKLIIGSKTIPIIEKNIIGMNSGGIRNINIPQDFLTEEPDLSKILASEKTDLRYQVTVLNVKKSATKINCN